MFQINLIGTTKLVTSMTAAVLEVGGVKPRHIVEILALSHQVAVSKEGMAEALWDGKPPSTYAATLESYVSVVRRHLRALGVPAGAISTVHDGYLLTDAVDVDISVLRATLRESQWRTPWHLDDVARAVPPPEVRLLSSSPYAAWAIMAREALDLEIAHELRRLAGRSSRAGDLELATTFLERAQHADPLSELTQQLLMRTLAARGARIDALVSFARFRRRLRDELGVDPGTETVELHLAILRSLEEGVHELLDRERALATRLLTQLTSDGRGRVLTGAGNPPTPADLGLAPIVRETPASRTLRPAELARVRADLLKH